MSQRIQAVHLFVSSNDDRGVLESVKVIEKNVSNIKFHKFSDLGHFTFNDMHTDKFPELFNVAIK